MNRDEYYTALNRNRELYHALGDERENHRYFQRIQVGIQNGIRKYRYFYSQGEYQAYLNHLKNKANSTLNNVGKKIDKYGRTIKVVGKAASTVANSNLLTTGQKLDIAKTSAKVSGKVAKRKIKKGIKKAKKNIEKTMNSSIAKLKTSKLPKSNYTLSDLTKKIDETKRSTAKKVAKRANDYAKTQTRYEHKSGLIPTKTYTTSGKVAKKVANVATKISKKRRKK